MITTVTLTGADDSISPKDLLTLHDDYPFVEFAILFSSKRQGTERYPSLVWIDELLTISDNLNLSAHLCGDYAREAVCGSHSGGELLKWLSPFFKRFQINYNFQHGYAHNMMTFNDILYRYPNNKFILQYNENNNSVCETYCIEKIPNLEFLYDASGGRGAKATKLCKPIKHHRTGYAGGISPENIINVCESVSDIAGKKNVWIDMETHIRSNNDMLFDFNKCNLVLAKAERFIDINPSS